MLEIRTKLKIARSAYKVEVRGQLKLPFEARQKSRLRTKLVSGEEVGLMLPRGEILRGGDLVTASDGRVVEIIAESEKLLHIETKELAKIAYHLGNRHVPVQVGDGFLRIAEDHVLGAASTSAVESHAGHLIFDRHAFLIRHLFTAPSRDTRSP